MKKTDQVLWIFLVAAAILWMAGCGKEKDCPESRAEARGPLTDELVSKIPYTGWETLKFYNDNGDTVLMQGSRGRFVTLRRDEIYNGEDCEQSYALYQSIGVWYFSTSNALESIYIYARSNDADFGNNVLTIHIGDIAGVSIDKLRSEYYRDTVYINTNEHLAILLINNLGVKTYYNHTEGIVKIIYPGGTNWYRKF